MKTSGSFRTLATAAAALSLVISSTASAATPALANAAPSAASPLVTLSVFGSASSRAALCAATTAAAAGAAATTAVQPAPGCVLPAVDAPPPPVAVAPPPPVAPYVAPAAGTANLLPLLAAVAAFGGIFFLLSEAFLGDDDGFDLGEEPCTDSPC